MKRFKSYMIIALSLMASVGCERQVLEDSSLIYARIPITIDWSESLIAEKDIDRISIYFYPKEGGEPTKVGSDDKNFKLVSLREGTYSVFVFNELYTDMRDVFDYQQISDYTDFNILSYNDPSFDPKNSFFEPAPNHVIRKKHQQFAVWSLDEFEVTQQMVDYTRTLAFENIIEEIRSKSRNMLGVVTKSDVVNDPSTKEITDALSVFNPVKPQPLTTINNIKVEIDNINNAQLIELVLLGSSDGGVLSTRDRINLSGKDNVYIDMRRTPYDSNFITMDEGSEVNGLVHHRMITFGVDPHAPEGTKYELQMNIILNSGKLEQFVWDVTSLLTQDRYSIDLDFTDSNKITLPESKGEGFHVDSWGDDHTVDLN